MPTPVLWSMVVQDGKLNVKMGGNVLVEHGPLINVQCHKEKLYHIKVRYIRSYYVGIEQYIPKCIAILATYVAMLTT